MEVSPRNTKLDLPVFPVGYPEELTLGTTSRCNINPPCSHCERNLRTIEKEFECPNEIIEKLGPVFPHLKRIYLHSGGEPLCSPSFFRILGRIKPPTQASFNTNGQLLNEKNIGILLASGVIDIINISLDAASENTYQKIRGNKFQDVISNIKDLKYFKNNSNSIYPKIVLSYCIMKENYNEIDDFVLLAKELGADLIMFSHLNNGNNWVIEKNGFVFDYRDQQKMDAEKHDLMVKKASALAAQSNLEILFTGSPLLNITGENISNKCTPPTEISNLSESCLKPWQALDVQVDGSVRVCCFHLSFKGQGVIGNLLKQNIDEIWNGPEVTKIRNQMAKGVLPYVCILNPNRCVYRKRI